MKQELDPKDLKLGMRYSAPVFFDDGESMFLAEDMPVKEFHLNTIKEWNVTKLVTYGHVIED
ncbi:MAG: hypothetical protein K5839_02870 [Treponemataceae bacterium]|nr:hypothetical protein [Treponemataceae bacterium]